MKKFNKLATLFLSALLSVTMISGCGNKSVSPDSSKDSTAKEESSSAAAPTEDIKSEMHIAINAAPATLDIIKTGGDVGRTIADGNIFEGIVNMKSDYTAGLELAESYEVNEDYTEWTYKLRQGVMFHNGQEMKADDVVASMNRWIECCSNASQMIGNSRFEKVDDYTVKISMEESLMYLNELMATAGQMPAIVPASTIADADPETGLLKEYIGTGPYKFDEWQQDQYIKIVKFDDYTPYGTPGECDARVGYKEAKTPDVYFDIVPDDATRVAGIQTGEYDFIYKLPLDNYSMFENNSDYTLFNDMNGSLGMIYNKKQGISADSVFRQAVNAALDMDAIMQSAYTDPTFYRLDSCYMYQEQLEWYTEAGKEYYNVKDMNRVKELLDEAGYNGETFTLLVSSDYQEFYNAAVVVENQLEKAGIDVTLLVCDWATFLSYRSDPTAFDGFITSWSPVALPTLMNWMTESYPGWVVDTKLIDMEKELNTSTSKEDSLTNWEEMQEYCWSTSLPISKFGDFSMCCVSSSKINNMIYHFGPFAWNATVSK